MMRFVVGTLTMVTLLGSGGPCEIAFATSLPFSNQPDYMEGGLVPQLDGSEQAEPSRLILIHIGFPDQQPEVGYPPSAAVDSMAHGLANSLNNQSAGRINLVPDKIVRAGSGDIWWMADYPMATYKSDTSVAHIPGGPRYSAHYVSEAEVDHLGELQAEILWKISNEYSGLGIPNPFVNASLFAFLYGGDVISLPTYPGAGGYGRNSVLYTTFPFLDDEISLDYLASPFYAALGTLPGCQMETSREAGNGRGYWNDKWVLSHEMGHYMLRFEGHLPYQSSCPDDPPISEDWHLNTADYKFGVYGQMRRTVIADKGMLPFHVSILRAEGWLDVNTVNSNQRNVVLGDVRLTRSMLRIPIPGMEEQEFLLTYHGGNGMDANLGRDGQPIYPSRGLSIWHMAGPYWTGVWDLESAWGRYDDPDTTSSGSGAWQTENAVTGFDNLDVYMDLCGADHGAVDYDAAYRYTDNYSGSSKDFFGAMSGKLEFSFRSNPNTFGQADVTSRRAPQGVPNPFVIRIIEEHDDYAVLDILRTPSERIVSPTAGSVLQRGMPCEIVWTTEFVGDMPGAIGTVDIFYSAGPQVTDLQIATSVLASTGHYTWTPGVRADLGTTGKIKLICHYRNYTSDAGRSESDGYLTMVDIPAAKFTDVSSQTGLVPPGVPYSAAPGDFQADEKNDLLITATGGDVTLGRVTLVLPAGAPLFGNTTVSNVVDGRGVAVADFDNDGDQDFFLAHESTPRLYGNQNGTFFDVTGTLSSLPAPSTAACWGDYDRDGWLDLYVVRSSKGYTEPPDYLNIAGVGHRLFRNLGATGGGFADVTAAAEIGGLAGNGSVSASWGDIENDGDLDLIVTNLQEPPTGPGGIGNQLFVNQGNGTFIEEFLDRFPAEFYYCTAAQWADINNDGFLDLAVSCAQTGSAIYFNDGSGHFPAEDRVWFDTSGSGFSGVQVFDHDLDGWNDVLWISRSASDPSQFFSGVPTATGVGFVNNTAYVGLSASSNAMGAVAADYTRDGDLDLFVGRPSSSGQYFYKTDSISGANALGRNYVKVRLDSPLKANNRQGMGATVSVTAGGLVQTRVVDGGSGRGGQQDRDLIFGLGDYSGTVTATVKWPRGHVQSGIPLFVSGPAAADSINTVVDETMVISNLNATSYVVPGTTLFDWVFSWETNVACDSNLDVLTIDQAGIQNPCWPGWTTLTPSTPGIVYTYEPKPGGGYLHKFTIYGQDCNLGCSFRYSAFSAMGANHATSATKTKLVKFCPSGF